MNILLGGLVYGWQWKHPCLWIIGFNWRCSWCWIGRGHWTYNLPWKYRYCGIDHQRHLYLLHKVCRSQGKTHQQHGLIWPGTYITAAYSPIHFKWNQYQSPVQLEKCTGYQSTSPFWIFFLDWSVHQSSPKCILILNFREMKCRNFQSVCSLLLHRNKALIGFNHKLFFKTIIFQNSSKVSE